MKYPLLALAALSAFVSHAAFAQSQSATPVGWVKSIGQGGFVTYAAPANTGSGAARSANLIWESAMASRSGGGATFRATTSLALGASEVAVVTRGAVSAASVFAAVKTIATGPVGIGLSVMAASPAILEYFRTNNSTLGPESALNTDKPFLKSSPIQELVCSTAGYSGPAIGSQSNAGCGELGAGTVSLEKTSTGPNSASCTVRNSCHPTVRYGTWEAVLQSGGITMPASWNDIAPYMDAPEKILPPALMEEVAKHVSLPIVYPVENADYFPSGVPSITGPASVAGTPSVSTTTTPEKTTSTTTTPRTDLKYGSVNDPVTGKPAPTVTARPGETVVVTETDTATGVTRTVSTTTTEATPAPEAPKEDLGTISDTPFGPIPKLYERKYPDGIKGVWRDKIAAIKAAPLFNLVGSLMPANIASSGTCPAFMIPVNFGKWGEYGNLDFSPPCMVWDFGKVIIIISALLLSRRLIFGG